MLTLVPHNDPILSKVCARVEAVTEEVQSLAADMVAFLPEVGGVGLAAPQIGKDLRLFVVDIWWTGSGSTENALVFINPEVKELTTQTAKRDEGCLSFPGIHEYITRCAEVEVTALGVDGEPFTMRASGLLGAAIQHETDHLNGITFLKRMGTLSRRLAMRQLQKAGVKTHDPT